MTQTHICIATATATCRLIIRSTTAGHPVAWPMLVADPCPFTKPAAFHGQDHAHVHYMTEPGPPWLRHAPCNRRPYRLILAEPVRLPPAATALAAPVRWAIDPRAIAGPCPSCEGPTAGGLCLKCRWTAALAGTA